MTLKDFIELFFNGNDDKVYIDIFDGDDFNEIYHEIRIIDPKLTPLYNRKIIALNEGIHNLGITLRKETEHEN